MVIKIKKLYGLLAALAVLAGSACWQFSRAVPAAAAVKTPLPVVMYHQVSKNPHRAGAYCVTLEELENDFEKSVFALHPEIGQIKERLYEMGAAYAAMSGSGSAVFGIFREKPDLNADFSTMYNKVISL